MNAFEEDLARALRDHAEGDVPVEALLGRAQRLGQRRRRRHMAGMGVALTLAMVTAVAVGGPALGALRHSGGGGPGTAGTALAAGHAGSVAASPAPSPSLSRPPVAAGARSATADPSVVGADPLLLHIDVADAAVPQGMSLVQWSSLGGLERLTLQTDITGASKTVRGKTVQVAQALVSRDLAQLDRLLGAQQQVRVGNVTGIMAVQGVRSPRVTRIQQVRWQPVPGFWAQIEYSGNDDAAAVRFAAALRFDHVLRCVVPYRLALTPFGTAVDSCSMTFDSLSVPSATGQVTVRLPTGGYVTVGVEPNTAPISGTTISGHPAHVREYVGDGGASILQIDIDYGETVADLVAEGKYNKATVLVVAEGFQPLPAGTPVSSWVADPLSSLPYPSSLSSPSSSPASVSAG